MAEKLVLRDNKWIIFFTLALVLTVTILIITGLYITSPLKYLSFKIIRSLHFNFGYLFLFLLVARYYYIFVSGYYKNLFPTIKEIKTLPQVFKYEFFLTDQKPPSGKYNVGQKILFTSWDLVFPFQVITGFALYDTTLSRPLDLFFGGYNYIRWYHFLATLYLTATITMHVYLVYTDDLARLKAIFTGYIVKKEPD